MTLSVPLNLPDAEFFPLRLEVETVGEDERVIEATTVTIESEVD